MINTFLEKNKIPQDRVVLYWRTLKKIGNNLGNISTEIPSFTIILVFFEIR